MKVSTIIGWGFGILIGIFVLNVILGTCNTANKMVDNAQKVVYDEYKPEELLRKYEWFKDASAQLDAKISNISSYESRFKSIKSSYGADSLNRKVWERSDKEQWNIWESECSGVKASYNDLAAEYNAAMSKFNYRFCNKGDLPQGAEMPLPRNYKPYLTQ